MRGRRGWLLAALLLAAVMALALQGRPQAAPVTDSMTLGLLLLDAENGTYILAVSDRSAADQAGLLPGDCIIRVGDEPLADSAAFNALLAGDEELLMLTILRDGEEIRLEMPCR